MRRGRRRALSWSAASHLPGGNPFSLYISNRKLGALPLLRHSCRCVAPGWSSWSRRSTLRYGLTLARHSWLISTSSSSPAVSAHAVRAGVAELRAVHISLSKRATRHGAALLYCVISRSTTAFRCCREADVWYSCDDSSASSVAASCVYATAPASFLLRHTAWQQPNFGAVGVSNAIHVP